MTPLTLISLPAIGKPIFAVFAAAASGTIHGSVPKGMKIKNQKNENCRDWNNEINNSLATPYSLSTIN
jgi:hypothetical protein